MAEYIEREAAIEAVFGAMVDGRSVFSALNNIPAADVQTVVLCRDCEMASPCTDDREVYCTLNHCYKKKSYFCADGKGEK